MLDGRGRGRTWKLETGNGEESRVLSKKRQPVGADGAPDLGRSYQA